MSVHAGQEALRKAWEINHPEKQDVIICTHCKQDSGWSNQEVCQIKVKENTSLKCQNCKKYCIHILTNASPTMNHEEYIVNKSKNPFSQDTI